MRQVRDLTSSYWFDVTVALLAIVAMLEVVLGRGTPGAPTTTLWFCLPAIAILVLCVLARRRFPFAGPAGYWVLAAAISFVDAYLIPYADALFPIGMADAFLLGNLRDARRAGAGLAIVVGAAAILVVNIPGHSVDTLVFVPLEFAISWIAGFAVRERAEQAEAAESRATLAEQERDAAARIAVAEERARIARELHDIVAHAVSVMVLQVGAVRHRLDPGLAEDREALQGVERAGRAALAEMRHLLDAMREDGERAERGPQPGLDRLEALLQDVGRAGLPVRLHVDGDPLELPRGIDISAYRIVQEGLTNALKHAHATHADVNLEYRPDQLRIAVRDNGRGVLTKNGGGHGLIGIGERVKLYGGEMSTASANGGGFTLSARLPLTEYRS
ncbi:MAG TPA: sensor histidine kinase [Solirubrobacteraceae bacterium]|nr:sensor histidine kinase [Solirubrobacteraceae bacterium]